VSYPSGSKTYAPGNQCRFKQQQAWETAVVDVLGIFFHKKAASTGCYIEF
jgi:hypothetical protein